jgi:hypothetical protein
MRRGDSTCLGGFFEAWGDRLYRLSLRLTGDPAAAEDVVQEAFLKLMAGAERRGSRDARACGPDRGGGALADCCLVEPMSEDTCDGFPTTKGVPDVKKCTDFATLDEPSGFNYAICNLGLIPNSERFGGHINWMPVTYAGLIFDRAHAPPDDDYNFGSSAESVG